jgi:hypothetical protein
MRERESFVVCYQWASGKENGGEWSKREREREGRERDTLLYVPLLLRYYPGVHICVRLNPFLLLSCYSKSSRNGLTIVQKETPYICSDLDIMTREWFFPTMTYMCVSTKQI